MWEESYYGICCVVMYIGGDGNRLCGYFFVCCFWFFFVFWFCCFFIQFYICILFFICLQFDMQFKVSIVGQYIIKQGMFVCIGYSKVLIYGVDFVFFKCVREGFFVSLDMFFKKYDWSFQFIVKMYMLNRNQCRQSCLQYLL